MRYHELLIEPETLKWKMDEIIKYFFIYIFLKVTLLIIY